MNGMSKAVGYLPMKRAQRKGIPDGAVVEINDRVWFVDHDGFRVVFRGWDTPLFRVAIGDKQELRAVAVWLRASRHATQDEIARAFGHSVESQRRWERRYEKEGLAGLSARVNPGRPMKIDRSQEGYVRRWFDEGVSNREIAARLAVDEITIRRSLRRLGLQRECSNPEPPLLPMAELVDAASTEEEPTIAEQAIDADQSMAKEAVEETRVGDFSNPLDRSFDRTMASIGLLDDALPIFANADGLPRVGVFLSVPLLARSGVLEAFERVYRTIGPAFYGLRTTVVCMFFLALLRIKRAEHLKEYSPQDLGRLLGLDRAPEVKTLRRKLHTLAGRGRGMELMHELASARIERDPDLIGILYLDGHVKEYHGKFEIPKTHITQRGLCAPAATDTWVNDVRGDPLFVVPSEVNEGLTQVLEPILAEAQELAGPDREITVVFDRGGWSPKLFDRLLDDGFHIITYRKGRRSRKIPGHQFEEREMSIDGREISYVLHDTKRVRVGRTGRRKSDPGRNYLWMRRVTRLRDGNRQTEVLTDRQDLPAELVLYLMFNRWRQENYFKYMDAEFALDALVAYGADPISADFDRPNPAVRAIEKELRRAKDDLAAEERALGQQLRDTVDISESEESIQDLLDRQAALQGTVDNLKQERKELPKRVSSSDQKALRREHCLVTDAVKMSAYQVEGALMSMLRDIYARNDDEGRTLLHAAFQSRGSIEVTPSEILVTLEPQSSPHRTTTVSRLCEKLNALGDTRFPGTDKRLKLAVRVPEPVIL